MTSRRYYSNSASVGIIADVLNNTDTTTNVNLSSGAPTSWPGQPCTAAINIGMADEEIVLVTAISGTNMTLTRGYNATAVRSHTASATITHCSIALDFDEANFHTSANSGVHGLAGAVVGTTDSQTLTNKMLIQPAIADYTNATHDHSSVAHGGPIPMASVTGLATALSGLGVDSSLVHIAGAETITGNKTFSGTTSFGSAVVLPSGSSIAAPTLSGTVNVTGTLTGLAENTANVVPQVVNASNAVLPGVVIHAGVATYTLSASAGATVTYNYNGIPFTSILNIQLTANAPALNRMDANVAAVSNSSVDIRIRQSENSPVSLTGSIYVLVIGTV